MVRKGAEGGAGARKRMGGGAGMDIKAGSGWKRLLRGVFYLISS